MTTLALPLASRFRALACSAIFATACGLPLPSWARTIPVENPTFDTPQELQPGQCVENAYNEHCEFHLTYPAPGWIATGPKTGVFRPTDESYDEPWTHGTVGFVGGAMEGPGYFEQSFGPMLGNGQYTIQVQVGCRLDKPCGGYTITVYFDDMPAHEFVLQHGRQVPGTWRRESLTFEADKGKVLKIHLSGSCICHRAEVDFDNFYLKFLKNGD